MKIFYFLVLINIVCTRYLNLEKLSSTYHDKKKNQFVNRHLENSEEIAKSDEDLPESKSAEQTEEISKKPAKKSKETKEDKEKRKKKELFKKLKKMEEDAIMEHLDSKKVAKHQNDVGYVNPVVNDTRRYSGEQDDESQDEQNQQDQQQEQVDYDKIEQKQIKQDQTHQGINSNLVKVTANSAKVQIDELNQQEQDDVIKSIKDQINNNNSRNPIIIINKPHQNLDQLIQQQKEKLQQIKLNQNQEKLPQYEPEIIGNTEANIDNKVYDEYGQVVSELSQVNDQTSNNNTINDKHYKFVNGSFQTNIQSDTINFNDIDTLIDTLGTIQKLFDSYYELAPKESEIMMEQKQEKEEQGMLDQTLRILQIYKRIKDFANIILTQGDELINDVHFLSKKVDKLKATEDDMLKFFNLQEKYYNVKLQASVYESQDSKFAKYFYEIHGISDTFTNNLKSVLREVFNIGKYTEFFMNTVHHMYNVTKFSSVVDVLKTIDQVLMMTLRLLEFHTDVNASVKQSKISLSNLKLQRGQILNSLDKIDTLTQYYKYGVVDEEPDNTKEVKKSSLILRLSMLFAMIILV